MKCIYNKSIPCELNPDGPMTKDFVCLKCHKPGKESKNESVRTQGDNKIRRRIFNARGKNRGLSPKKRGLGRGRGRRR
jgi:hypothetical protein